MSQDCSRDIALLEEGTPAAPVANQPQISFCAAWWNIVSVGLSIFLSFTISLAAFLSSVYLGKMPDSLNGSDVLTDEELTAFYASVGLNPTFFNTVLAIVIALLFGVAPYANNRQGALKEAERLEEPRENIEKIESTISYINFVTTLAAVGLSIPVLLVYLFSKEILIGIGQDELVAEYSSAHLTPWAAGATAVLVRIGGEQSLVPAGKQAGATAIDWVTFIIAAVLAYCLPFLVWRDWGFISKIAAVSWCFALEAWPTTLLNIIYMIFQKDIARFRFFRIFNYEGVDKKTALKAMVSQSGPSLLNTITEFLMSFLVSTLAGWVSLTGQAALSPSMVLFNFTFLISLAMAFASAAMAGNAAGEGNVQQTRQYVRAAHLASLSIVGLISFFTFIYPRWVVDVLSNDYGTGSGIGNESGIGATSLPPQPFNKTTQTPESELLCNQNEILARLMALVIFLGTWRFTDVALMRSQGSPWLALILSSGGELIGLIIGVLLAFYTDLQVAGLLTGWAIGESLGVLGLFPQVLYYCHEQRIKEASQRIQNPSCKEIPAACTFLREKVCSKPYSHRERERGVKLEDRRTATMGAIIN